MSTTTSNPVIGARRPQREPGFRRGAGTIEGGRLRSLLAAIVSGVIAGCAPNAGGDGERAGNVQKAHGNEIHPESFVASIGGFMGASYRVELEDDGSLLYSHNPHTFTSAPGTTRVRIGVTEEQWREFRQALDAARVWAWRKSYRRPGVQDGTQWSLRIVYSEASVTSEGDNAYPPKESYEDYCRAVTTLLGGRTFR